MNDELSQDKNKKDPVAALAETNACGLCKPFKLPICKGHGGAAGGSGGSSDGGSEENKKETGNSSTNESGKVDVSAYLQESKYWHPVSVLDNTLIFTKPDALLSLSLKFGAEEGVLQFRGNKELSTVDKKALHEFFHHIIEEFEKFKNENGISAKDFTAVFSEKDNTLTVTIPTIPNKDYFNLFITQLMKNNLIPTPHNLALSQEIGQEKESKMMDSFYPNPFDISKGPKQE